ncbi:DUF3302 domain-containing protein [Alginatibacterium sediminis]|uniref:DUF3302 domain-containing protein n=1 Tax=Alginatibacterium sediminis TaxID=2164068 RepID=A0A420E5T1_9ALTE|nr:DUF3302 domain-containing protein [Alginatibacterium sediminis]RKF13209.1 DUF3302 domain-containing protein [Alginatibacterium sediminis]
MFLDFFALGLLVFVGLTIFYGVIAIHDIPYEIAKKRNHPQQDALHVAGWVSLFTLHVLWPFLWIWATLYREDRGWGFVDKTQANNNEEAVTQDTQLPAATDTAQLEKIEKLEQQLQLLQRQMVLLSRQNQLDESSSQKEQ